MQCLIFKLPCFEIRLFLPGLLFIAFIFQASIFFYYYIPYFVAAICFLIHPSQHWVKDWTVIYAGASVQAQLVYIWCSLKWRTPEEYQVPNTPIARTVFWSVNLGLVLLPHLFTIYCHRYELNDWLVNKVLPKLRSFHGDVKSSQVTTKKIDMATRRNGPVTRGQKKSN